MISKVLKLSFIVISLFAIISCKPFASDSLTSICESDPELCADITKLTDCRYQRTYLIRARYYNKIEPTGVHTRALFDRMSEYKSCLELTLSMQYTRNKERKAARLENYLLIQKLMKAELNNIKGTQDPLLAYYLWTHHQDLKAKKVFLKAAHQEDLKDSSLLSKLAIYYSQYDKQLALDLFYKALRESNSIEEIPSSIYIHIMTIFYQSKYFEEAYLWSLVAIAEDPDNELSVNLDLILQKGFINGKKLIENENALEEQAKLYRKQLSNNEFITQAPILIAKASE